MEREVLAKGIHALAEKLKSEEGLSIGQIATAGGLSRQAAYQSHADKDDLTLLRVTGWGLSVIAAAVQRGYVSEVLSILSGRQLQETTVLNAVLIYPDLSVKELQLLQQAEDMLNVRPLPGNLVESLIATHRTSTA